MSKFKSKKSIVNWLNQRKVIMYSNFGFTYFYKMIKGRLYVYNRPDKRWEMCIYDDIEGFFSNTNNWYKSKQSEMRWI